MQLYNTMTRRVELVQPRDGTISMYVCGITPYDVGHLGHMLTYLTYDVLRRRLEDTGVRVRHVQNITDVDDDIIRKSAETGLSPEELTDKNVALFDADFGALNGLRADVYPKVSETMPEIITMVQRLLEQGNAYAANGDVYFDISTFPRYGALRQWGREEMLAESKRQNMRPGPRDPLDFLLWQAKAPGEPFWATPWGEGRPGWHIECTAMAVKHLGPRVDIHGGGADLVYPHHESEIAQSETATGEAPFVQTWAHIGMLRYQGEKMSKSLGNLVLARDLLREHPADAVRLALYSRHYREAWEWDEAAMAKGSRQAAILREAAAVTGGNGPAIDHASVMARIWTAIDDDLRLDASVDELVMFAEKIIAAAQVQNDVSAAQRELRRAATVLGLTLLA